MFNEVEDFELEKWMVEGRKNVDGSNDRLQKKTTVSKNTPTTHNSVNSLILNAL